MLCQSCMRCYQSDLNQFKLKQSPEHEICLSVRTHQNFTVMSFIFSADKQTLDHIIVRHFCDWVCAAITHREYKLQHLVLTAVWLIREVNKHEMVHLDIFSPSLFTTIIWSLSSFLITDEVVQRCLTLSHCCIHSFTSGKQTAAHDYAVFNQLRLTWLLKQCWDRAAHNLDVFLLFQISSFNLQKSHHKLIRVLLSLSVILCADRHLLSHIVMRHFCD